MSHEIGRRRFLKTTSTAVVAGGALPRILSASPLVPDGVPTRVLEKSASKSR